MPANIRLAARALLAVMMLGVLWAIRSGATAALGCCAVGLLLSLALLWFMRDPERKIPTAEGCVLSAADGRVCSLQHQFEDHFLKSEGISIGIFLSLFDVHVNRIPVSGIVRFLSYRSGLFLRADSPRASTQNEQQLIGIESRNGRILVKQIAGKIARRVVCRLHAGDQVKTGDRFGMIILGSKVEVVMPMNTEIAVHVGDRVRAGETILGRMK